MDDGSARELQRDDAAGDQGSRGISPAATEVSERVADQISQRRCINGRRTSHARNAPVLLKVPERLRGDQLWPWNMDLSHAANDAARRRTCLAAGQERR